MERGERRKKDTAMGSDVCKQTSRTVVGGEGKRPGRMGGKVEGMSDGRVGRDERWEGQGRAQW